MAETGEFQKQMEKFLQNPSDELWKKIEEQTKENEKAATFLDSVCMKIYQLPEELQTSVFQVFLDVLDSDDEALRMNSIKSFGKICAKAECLRKEASWTLLDFLQTDSFTEYKLVAQVIEEIFFISPQDFLDAILQYIDAYQDNRRLRTIEFLTSTRIVRALKTACELPGGEEFEERWKNSISERLPFLSEQEWVWIVDPRPTFSTDDELCRLISRPYTKENPVQINNSHALQRFMSTAGFVAKSFNSRSNKMTWREFKEPGLTVYAFRHIIPRLDEINSFYHVPLIRTIASISDFISVDDAEEVLQGAVKLFDSFLPDYMMLEDLSVNALEACMFIIHHAGFLLLNHKSEIAWQIINGTDTPSGNHLSPERIQQLESLHDLCKNLYSVLRDFNINRDKDDFNDVGIFLVMNTVKNCMNYFNKLIDRHFIRRGFLSFIQTNERDANRAPKIKDRSEQIPEFELPPAPSFQHLEDSYEREVQEEEEEEEEDTDPDSFSQMKRLKTADSLETAEKDIMEKAESVEDVKIEEEEEGLIPEPNKVVSKPAFEPILPPPASTNPPKTQNSAGLRRKAKNNNSDKKQHVQKEEEESKQRMPGRRVYTEPQKRQTNKREGKQR